MSTKIRPELSKKNMYWISKHRYYELKHFCLQYPEWKKENLCLQQGYLPCGLKLEEIKTKWTDPTANAAIRMAKNSSKIKLVEDMAYLADKEIGKYILIGVTEGKSFDCLKSTLEIPCERDYYYDRYRKFFWHLSKER